MTRPNFIVLYADDQGYGDMSCNGATDLRTPGLDRIAAEGARFTNWYTSAPVCSPARGSLLTGRYPIRAGVRDLFPADRDMVALMPEVPTLSTVLQQHGYRTAMFGKWHLGGADISRPDRHGFDEWFGFLSGCIDFYSHVHYYQFAKGKTPLHDLWDNGVEAWHNGAYFTDLIADRAIAYLRRRAADGEPFFLYLPFNAPHYPLHAPQRYFEMYAHLDPDRRAIAAMMAAYDEAVTAILNEFDRLGLADNTCVFASSDHGPERSWIARHDGDQSVFRGGSAGPLRGHKKSLFDGGIRVPAVIRWPDRIKAGRVLEQVGSVMDIFPTFLRAAGIDPSPFDIDGRDIGPVMDGDAPSPHDELMFEFRGQRAMRAGRWKLVLDGHDADVDHTDAVHLSDIEADVGERHNLAEQHPDVVADLRARLDAWFERQTSLWDDYWMTHSPGAAEQDKRARSWMTATTRL